MTQHIALMGRARAGKDTVAARLVEPHGYTRIAFADPIKRMALDIDPIMVANHDWGPSVKRLSGVVEFWGWERAKDQYPGVRRILQHIGQTVRDLDPEFWIRVALRELDSVSGPVVVTDVRYPNEAEALRARGFRLVRVIRPGQDLTNSHASETALDDYQPNAVVVNAGSLSELRMRADALAA
ncbi:deoxynucleotide monophosphate kinase family protein [Streptomyces noursei]|uniref:deoxynucleotide monophosphate kinase family protein n=1 Tax=Streptomyces noursei TaxID=1971 RepID=UPI003828704C